MSEADTSNSQSSRLDQATQQIRSAGKWLIAAAAAVGAALIAGSQLSSIGKLDTCSDWGTVACSRLPVAVSGAVMALASVVLIVWMGTRLLLPVAVSLNELDDHWKNPGRWADGKFFRANPQYLSVESPEALERCRSEAWNRLWNAKLDLEAATEGEQPAKKHVLQNAEAEFERWQDQVRTVTGIASFQLLQAHFRSLLWKLLGASAFAAIGIVAFAWAANPPEPASSTVSLRAADLTGADLRDTDLSGADLRDADLSFANLQGADLTDARIAGIRWSSTICPDGSNSDDNGNTCRGHITP
ncbi:MAG TPA: pentapeptide repeat-containing protein [Jiangellaceae bacterium]